MSNKPNPSILIVDDNEINLMLMVDVLEVIGITKIKTLNNGLEAVKEMKKCLNFDVILMDICMPIMDGYEASKQIRHLGYRGQIIALTANEISKLNSEFLEAKMDGFILKPVDINEVDKILRSV